MHVFHQKGAPLQLRWQPHSAGGDGSKACIYKFDSMFAPARKRVKFCIAAKVPSRCRTVYVLEYARIACEGAPNRFATEAETGYP